MARDEKISLFFRQFTQEQRVIIDYISGLIFEHFPNIKETIGESTLKYISTEHGSLFFIEVKEEKVRFYFKKKDFQLSHISKSYLIKQHKSYYFLNYDTFKRINRDTILEILNRYHL